MDQKTIDVQFRRITPEDIGFLWRMLYYSAHMEDDPGSSIDSARQDKDVSKYLHDWPRSGDMGVLAFDGSTDKPIGAAWVRLLTADEAPYFYIDDHTPELIVALEPEYRGQGLGTRLLTELLQRVDKRFPVVSLNVREDNRARQLYERLGFRQYGEPFRNRKGGWSLIMTKRLS